MLSNKASSLNRVLDVTLTNRGRQRSSEPCGAIYQSLWGTYCHGLNTTTSDRMWAQGCTKSEIGQVFLAPIGTDLRTGHVHRSKRPRGRCNGVASDANAECGGPRPHLTAASRWPFPSPSLSRAHAMPPQLHHCHCCHHHHYHRSYCHLCRRRHLRVRS
jgi:hypothetical protein